MKKRRPWKKQKRCYRKGRRKDRRRNYREDKEQWAYRETGEVTQ